MEIKQKLDTLIDEINHWQIEEGQLYALEHGYPQWQQQAQYYDRITYVQYDDLFDIYFYGDGSISEECEDWPFPAYSPMSAGKENFNNYDSGYTFYKLCHILLEHQENIIGIHLNGPDEGSDGIRSWDLEALAKAPKEWLNLQVFDVQLWEQGMHNYVCIGENSPEDSRMLSACLKKMPQLNRLQLPSPPSESFFDFPPKHLKHFRVQSIFDHHNCIENLCKSPLLDQLIAFDFMDVVHDKDLSYLSPEEIKFKQRQKELEAEGLSDEDVQKQQMTDLMEQLHLPEDFIDFDNYEQEEEVEESPTLNQRTSFIMYDQLMVNAEHNRNKNNKLPSFHFTLRDSYLSKDEVYQLHETGKNVQFLYVPMQEEYYVSHRYQDDQKLGFK